MTVAESPVEEAGEAGSAPVADDVGQAKTKTKSKKGEEKEEKTDVAEDIPF